jgi:putative holliday junction resolvase
VPRRGTAGCDPPMNGEAARRRALGLDVGSRTIGVAISDPGRVIASARTVLRRAGHEDDARAVVGLALAEDVSTVVVGLPLELDGTVGRRARAVRRFLEVLEPALRAEIPDVAVVPWDERFSTHAAERTLLEADMSRAKRKTKIDALAAQFILQGWLDARSTSEP